MCPDDPGKPIRSLHEDDPELEERIDAFVVRLGEIVDLFQDTEAAGKFAALQGLAGELAEHSDALGYPALGDASRSVEDACREASAEAVHKRVADLTAIAQRIRMGHRSAA